MSDTVDIESYPEANDLPPDDPAPREPKGDPDTRTEQYDIWAFDAERSPRVPDTYVVDRDPEPLDFRMWVFTGEGDKARFIMRASHKYGVDEAEEGGEDCCEVLLESQSLTADHCPDEVAQLVADLVQAEVILPKKDPSAERDSPIEY